MSRFLIISVFSMCRKGVVFLILFKNTIRLSAGSLIASVDSLIAFLIGLLDESEESALSDVPLTVIEF